MSIIPCGDNKRATEEEIDRVAEKLKTEAHSLGGHTLEEAEFYSSGLFRSAIERIRGQFSATMGQKREFVSQILNHMQANNFISDWGSAGSANRHDYEVTLKQWQCHSNRVKRLSRRKQYDNFRTPTKCNRVRYLEYM